MLRNCLLASVVSVVEAVTPSQNILQVFRCCLGPDLELHPVVHPQ